MRLIEHFEREAEENEKFVIRWIYIITGALSALMIIGIISLFYS